MLEDLELVRSIYTAWRRRLRPPNAREPRWRDV